MIIFCSKPLLRDFRRECRQRYPREHFAALYGKRSEEGNFLVTRVSPIAHTSDNDGVSVSVSSINRSKRKALQKDEEFLGTIHSHCFEPKEPCCWHLSTTDVKTALQWGEAICGLVYVYDNGKRTSMHWYIPLPPPQVVYG